MDNQPVVQLKQVTKVIGRKKIIDDLSFTVQRGQVYGFLGPNGSGKTTTIRMIVGLISITAGEIYVEGYNIKTERNKALENVGAIVENPELYGYMSGMRNLIHFARMSTQRISQERIEEVIRLVDLEDAIHQKVKTYSLGMKQRLGIAQALLHKPSILILDEPTNGLDPAGIRQIRDYLRYLAKQENIAILVSSHLLSEVELMCDRVVIIQEGKFVEELVIAEQTHSEDHPPTSTTIFEVNAPAQAIQLLSNYGAVAVDEQSIAVDVPKAAIPQIISTLVAEQIGIYQVQIVKDSLEDRFLNLTRKGRGRS